MLQKLRLSLLMQFSHSRLHVNRVHLGDWCHLNIAWLMLSGWFIVLLYATLFPFDFYWPAHASLVDFLAQGKWSLLAPELRNDMPRNVLLYIPLGFLLAVALSQQWTLLRRLATSTGAAALLSCSTEIVQYFVLVRYTALTDIVTNIAGAALGVLLSVWWGVGALRAMEHTGRMVCRGVLRLPPACYLVLWVIWFAAISFFSVHAAGRTHLDNWAIDYPLLIGNEATGDRHWKGSVDSVYVGSDALAIPVSIGALSAADPAALLGSHLLAHYQLNQSGDYIDTTARQPILSQRRDKDTVWWESTAPPTSLNEAIASSGQFTLIADITPKLADQTGPARIISLSSTAFDRNLTIGQEGTDLVIRLRTPFMGPNGRAPEFHIAGAFSASQRVRLVVTYAHMTLRVYLSNMQPTFMVTLRPEFLAIVGAAPVEMWGLTLNTAPLWFYQFLYCWLIFGLSGVLSALFARRYASESVRWFICAIGSILTPLLLESVVQKFGGYPPAWGTAFVGIAVSVIAASATFYLINNACGHATRSFT